MNLYENKNLFIDYIKKAAEFFGINETLIEKDFYIYLFLKECSKVIPQLVFKGGTSLSKCHKIIDRFSEDIDLTLKGNKFLRSSFYLAVNQMLQRNIDNQITRFYFKKKSSGLSHKVAAVASCRKLACTIFGMLSNGTCFETI